MEAEAKVPPSSGGSSGGVGDNHQTLRISAFFALWLRVEPVKGHVATCGRRFNLVKKKEGQPSF